MRSKKQTLMMLKHKNKSQEINYKRIVSRNKMLKKLNKKFKKLKSLLNINKKLKNKKT